MKDALSREEEQLRRALQRCSEMTNPPDQLRSEVVDTITTFNALYEIEELFTSTLSATEAHFIEMHTRSSGHTGRGDQ